MITVEEIKEKINEKNTGKLKNGSIVDPLMKEVLDILNDKKITTQYSCQGHLDDHIFRMYISFNSIHNFKNLPKGFVLHHQMIVKEVIDNKLYYLLKYRDCYNGKVIRQGSFRNKIFDKNNIPMTHSLIEYEINNKLSDEKFYRTYKNKMNSLIEWAEKL